jgi:hypothetical protein
MDEGYPLACPPIEATPVVGLKLLLRPPCPTLLLYPLAPLSNNAVEPLSALIMLFSIPALDGIPAFLLFVTVWTTPLPAAPSLGGFV